MARTPGKRPKGRWIALGVLGLLVTVGLVAFLVVRPNAAPPTIRTQDVTVTRTTEKVTVSLTGTLAAARQAELSFGAAGKVTAVAATVGERVTQGAVLARIDDTTLRDAVALAQAQLTAAQANLTSVRKTSGATSAQISSARAQVNSADARLASARSQLASATITAPFDGTVAAVNIDVGDQTTGGAPTSSGIASASGVSVTGVASTGSQAAIVIVTPDAWVVNASVGPADVASLKAGQSATVSVQGTSVTAPATVRTVGIVASTASGATAFPVTLDVQGNPTGLYYGASVNVLVDAGTFGDLLTLPTNALTSQGQATTVQKLVDGQPVTTPVTTGKVFGDRTQVVSGLSEGDVVRVTTRVAPQGQRTGFPGFGGGSGSGGMGPGGGTGPGGAAPPGGGTRG